MEAEKEYKYKDVFNQAVKHFKKKEFYKALEYFQKIPDIYAIVNQCIIIDRLGLDEELATRLSYAMKWFKSNDCNDYRIWWVLVFLNHKIQKFENVILCVNRSLALNMPEDWQIEALIRKGYCLEALKKFGKAIKTYQEIPEKYLSIHPFKAEIYHGLGHFYNERGNFKKSIADIKKAENYMKKAADLNSIYYPCLGTIHSENKNYHKALRIFDEALQKIEIRSDDHIYNEILFYKADALSWLGDYTTAYELFNAFENYCNKYDNRDGKTHCTVYRIETQLREKTMLEITLNDLKSWMNLLETNKPSLYINKSIHVEWRKLGYLLEGIHNLKRLLEGILPENEISKVADSFKNAMKISKIEVLTLTDDPQNVITLLSEENCSPKIISEDIKNNGQKLLGYHDVWLVILFKQCPPRFIAWIAENAEKTIILYHKDSTKIDIPPEVKRKTFITPNINDAIATASLLSLYDILRKDLIKPFFLFGLAPTTQAPSYSAQTGWIDELIIPEGL